MSVMIGIDPHKGSHAAAAVNGDEEVVAEVEVKATKRQTRELLDWAERFPERRWAVESANGHGYLLAQQLVAAGEHVVDVPSTLASRARVLDSTRAQKNDANDARSVAIVALHQDGLRQVRAEDHVAVLRMLPGLARLTFAELGVARLGRGSAPVESRAVLARPGEVGGSGRVAEERPCIDMWCWSV